MTKRFSETFNWSFFFVVCSLVAVGLLNLYSAVFYWEESGSLSIFWNQLVWVSIGFLVMAATTFIDYRLFKDWGKYFYFIVLCMLAFTALFGQEIRGTKGWIRIGSVGIQPAEFAKLTYIFVMAKYFNDHPSADGYGVRELWKPALLTFLPFGIILYQGDMGSAFFLLAIFVSISLFLGVKKKTLLVCIALAFLAGVGTYKFGLKEYQRNRILAFMHPEEDVRGKGYHLMQSKIAVGSGKVFGKGYLKGNINKLQYLPERHTDFIFPVLAEEWGFVGSLFVLGLYLSFLLLGVDVAKGARDRFGIFLVMGIVAWLSWQLVINLGGVLGLIPLTGVTLPFLSYGGSSIIVMLAASGFVLNVSLRKHMF